MMKQNIQLDHICLAVKNIDKAAKSFSETLGYQLRTEKVVNTQQQVIVQFLSLPGSLDIKLIQPSGKDSPLFGFLRKGEGLHHLCFKVPEITAAVESLKQSGGRITADPEPGEAFDNELIAFAYLGSGMNIEIIDTDKRRGCKKS